VEEPQLEKWAEESDVAIAPGVRWVDVE